MRDLRSRFESAFDQAPIGMVLLDREGRWLEVNDAFCRLTGYSRNELEATTLAGITVPDDLHLDARLNHDLLGGRITTYQVEKRYRHAEGHPLWVLVSASLVRDDDGQPLYMISQMQDISKRREIAERLQYQVDRDFLTGLFNRRRFERELTREARRVARYGSSGAVVLIDLDRFKDVNDAFGHKAGDDLLKAVAGTLTGRMRQTDVLARVGGDEFAVLLPQTGAKRARIVAEGIVETLRRNVPPVGERSIFVTASVGVALIDGLTAENIMDHADRAMYEAKAAGRDRFAMDRLPRSGEERVHAVL
jgi:diguanylate cyclase (GGDEF)-like protein/PAS domain S-box-containing protein